MGVAIQISHIVRAEVRVSKARDKETVIGQYIKLVSTGVFTPNARDKKTVNPWNKKPRLPKQTGFGKMDGW